jgi:hypothetical protein
LSFDFVNTLAGNCFEQAICHGRRGCLYGRKVMTKKILDKNVSLVEEDVTLQ